jgi:hypothetical protein
VVSGRDPFKNNQPYVNQVFVAYAGGGARFGYDGWLTYCGPANGGMINLDSVEIDEAMYPFIIESRGVEPDTQGLGEFEGSPGVAGVFYPVDHAMTVVYAADGTTFPPQRRFRRDRRRSDAKPKNLARKEHSPPSRLQRRGLRRRREDEFSCLRRRRVRASVRTRPRTRREDDQPRMADARQGRRGLWRAGPVR